MEDLDKNQAWEYVEKIYTILQEHAAQYCGLPAQPWHQQAAKKITRYVHEGIKNHPFVAVWPEED